MNLNLKCLTNAQLQLELTKNSSSLSSGNKLSYLNGEILLRLPQLNALQLAQNKWRCDCRLRKLVRQLVQFGDGPSAPHVNAPLATTSQYHHQLTVILQDEPRCWRGHAGKTQSVTMHESIRSGDSIVRAGNSERALQEEVEEEASEQDNATMTSSPAMRTKQNLSAELGAKTKRADDDEDDVERHEHHQREALDAGPWTNMSKYRALSSLASSLARTPPISTRVLPDCKGHCSLAGKEPLVPDDRDRLPSSS